MSENGDSSKTPMNGKEAGISPSTESATSTELTNYYFEKYLIKSAVKFKIGNRELEAEEGKIFVDRKIVEKFGSPSSVIQISPDELKELENELFQDNFNIANVYKKITSDENISLEDKNKALKEMILKQEELCARALAMKYLHTAILGIAIKPLITTEDYNISKSDSANERAPEKLNLTLEEQIYEGDSKKLDDISEYFDHTKFVKPMSPPPAKDADYLKIMKSLPTKDEIYTKEDHRQLQTLTWKKYCFIKEDVLFFYAPHLEFPKLRDDIERCRPFIQCDTRTPPQFLREYREKIGRYLEREIWKISRFALILQCCAETEYIVEIIKRYLRSCVQENIKPVFARVEQLFLEETWNKDDQELIEKEFSASYLEPENWEMAVEFVIQWNGRLNDLTLSNIGNPSEAIFKKLPEKFREWFHVHYKDHVDLKEHIVLCSSLRKYSKLYLSYLKSQKRSHMTLL